MALNFRLNFTTAEEYEEDYDSLKVLNALQSLSAENLEYREATQEIAFRFAIVFCTFGLVAVLVNIFVMFLLLRHWRRMFRHVFYLLVLNFALIDILKGLCLILWSGMILKPPPTDQLSRIVAMKIDQITLVVLRTCNLETIFNLLMITFNEYFFIKYPLVVCMQIFFFTLTLRGK